MNVKTAAVPTSVCIIKDSHQTLACYLGSEAGFFRELCHLAILTSLCRCSLRSWQCECVLHILTKSFGFDLNSGKKKKKQEVKQSCKLARNFWSVEENSGDL